MSSTGSRILYALALAIALLACSVNGHGWMSYPKPRGQYLSPPKPAYMEYGPASTDPASQAFVCRNDPVAPKANWIPLTAGGKQSITLEFNARHVGDCFVYLSYDGDKPEAQQKWFKIWEQHACKDSNNYDITIPDYLPSGDHVIFRWEWYALHVYPTVEYYAQCVDAVMTGKSNGQLPDFQLAMPGHLPKFAGEYRAAPAKADNNYWWPWDNQPMFFTGPDMALDPRGTKAPTTKPATAKPTDRPATYPPATTKPTDRPATSTPATRPPVAATTKPGSGSVKLNVQGSIGEWWVAVSFTGSRAAEINKVELIDSGSITQYKAMAISWGDVWAYSPAVRLTLPLTVRASLPGSSITFTVNSYSTATVDSGVSF